MKIKKAFLTYVYSAKNAGDLAICIGAIDLLVEQDYHVTLLSKYNRKDPEYLSSKQYYEARYGTKVKMLEAPFTLNRSEGIIKKAIHNFNGLSIFLGIASNKQAQAIEEEINKCDLVIFNGGNLLRCSSFIDYVRLVALSYPIKIAKRLKKEYIIFPHSSAHINYMGEAMIGNMLRGAKMVFAREEESYNKLKQMYNLDNIYSSIDLAFFIKNNLTSLSADNRGLEEKIIGFTFRAHTVGDIHEFDEKEKQHIYDNIARVLKELGVKHRYYFIIQTVKDKGFTTDLQRRLEKDVGISISIFENYDPIELIRFYSHIDLLIGMRLHSLILAISIGTPAYGVFYEQWGLKNSGLMKKLDLPYVLLDSNGWINVNEVQDMLQNKDVFSRRIKSLIHTEKSALVASL